MLPVTKEQPGPYTPGEIDEESPFGRLIAGQPRTQDATLIALGGIYHAQLALMERLGTVPPQAQGKGGGAGPASSFSALEKGLGECAAAVSAAAELLAKSDTAELAVALIAHTEAVTAAASAIGAAVTQAGRLTDALTANSEHLAHLLEAVEVQTTQLKKATRPPTKPVE